jgi:histidinol-phosphatase (PHP family)
MQKFNYHSHTYRCKHSDKNYSDEEYVVDYIKNGFKKIAFTDHCPEKNKIDKREDMRMDYSQKEEYIESINKLKNKYSNQIEIKSGFEVEYLPGEEKNIEELKRMTDITVLGQHFVYDDDNVNLRIIGTKETCLTDKEIIKYAKYIEKASELGIPNIIAHPDLFMKKRNKFESAENEATRIICESAEKYNIPLEINLNNIFRTVYMEHKKIINRTLEEQDERIKEVCYPYKKFWEIAAQYNIQVLYGLDTHQRGQIDRFNELIILANKIIGNNVINKMKFVNDL